MIHRKRRFEIAVGLVLALIVTSCCEGTAMETMRAYAASAENWSVVHSDDLGFSKVYAVGGHVVIGMKDGVVCFYNLSTKKETKTKRQMQPQKHRHHRKMIRRQSFLQGIPDIRRQL
mgnify:CR=1 FL=1